MIHQPHQGHPIVHQKFLGRYVFVVVVLCIVARPSSLPVRAPIDKPANTSNSIMAAKPWQRSTVTNSSQTADTLSLRDNQLLANKNGLVMNLEFAAQPHRAACASVLVYRWCLPYQLIFRSPSR